ncbi:hypothetical protein ACFSTC_50550 [Nonomuraea ferruginea]
MSVSLTERIRSIKNRARRMVEGWRVRRPSVDHLIKTVQRYQAQSGDRLAGGVTYFAFLSFFPLIALAFALLGYVVTVSATVAGGAGDGDHGAAARPGGAARPDGDQGRQDDRGRHRPPGPAVRGARGGGRAARGAARDLHDHLAGCSRSSGPSCATWRRCSCWA